MDTTHPARQCREEVWQSPRSGAGSADPDGPAPRHATPFRQPSGYRASGPDLPAVRKGGHRLAILAVGFYDVSPETIQWQQRLSANASDESPTDFNIDPEEENNSDEDTNEYQSLLETFDNLNSLYPTTGYEQLESNSTPINQITRLGPTPTVSTIAKLVRESLPLNKKLFLVVEMILDHVRVRPRLGLSPLAYRPHTGT